MSTKREYLKISISRRVKLLKKRCVKVLDDSFA